MPPSNVARLGALLGTVVAVGSGQATGGQSVAALGDYGPITVQNPPALGPGPDQPRVELIAGLVHLIVPSGPQRIDILVPSEVQHRDNSAITIRAEWMERARLAAAGIQLAQHQGSKTADDWTDLLKEQAVVRDDTIRRYSLSLERAIDRYIRDHNAAALLRHLAAQPLDRDAGRLADGNVLRGVQDLIISLLAVATRSATSAGTIVPVAFGISDYFIREIERATRVEQLTPLLMRALTALAESVDQSRQHGRSVLVRAVEEWILVHLDEDLRPSSIAAAFSMNSAYLAIQFRRETGTTIDRYVQGRKIEQAQTMLTHTTLSIADIYTRLNFYDQSHFSRVFRKLTGETPHHYRTRTRPRALPEPEPEQDA